MDFSPIQEVAKQYGCQLIFDEPLAKHTTMRIGGRCGALVKPSGMECLQALIKASTDHGIRRFLLGKGSNTLFSDAGYKGLVIVLGEDFSAVQVAGEYGDELLCEAGAKLADVCKFALAQGLTGLEFAYGIPGTVGGAVYMNAGAYGGQMSDVVASCTQIDAHGQCGEVTREQMNLSYRHSAFCQNGCAIAQIRLKLQKGDPALIKARMEELMACRVAKQPLEYPSAGSTFKRPQGSYASLLIDQCGLKGQSIGGAQVSEKHAGFIINRDNASFSDIMALVALVKERVYEQTGYKLECEMLIVEG